MNHSIIGRALLLGALLLSGVAHAETEDIPLPGDVQNAPVKTVKQSTRHQGTGTAVKRGGKEYRSVIHAKRVGHVHAKKKTGKLRKTDGRSANVHKAKVPGKGAATHSLHTKKYKMHKSSKNNNIKKNIKKKHKKLH